MCAKYQVMPINKRSIYRLAENLLQASNDSSIDKSVWFRFEDAKMMTSMQVGLLFT